MYSFSTVCACQMINHYDCHMPMYVCTYIQYIVHSHKSLLIDYAVTVSVNTESVPTNPTLSGGAVAGVVVAVILVLIIVIFIVISTILLVGRTKIKDYAKIYFTTNGKGTGMLCA